MSIRKPRLALAAAAFLAGSVLAAAPASAVPAVPADCSVVDLSPATIAVGIGLKTHVTFAVGTDCDATAQVNWYLNFNEAGATQPYTGPLLANFPVPAGSRGTYIKDGAYTWDVGTEQYAGLYNVDVNAFLGPATDHVDLATTRLPVTVLHRTTFGSTFNASPEPRKVGQKISITGALKYANWKTAAYQGVGEYVMLQFRPTGADDYQNVKWVWDNGVVATTTVKAVKTGSWRYQYLGDAKNLTAASNSEGDTVVVKPAK